MRLEVCTADDERLPMDEGEGGRRRGGGGDEWGREGAYEPRHRSRSIPDLTSRLTSRKNRRGVRSAGEREGEDCAQTRIHARRTGRGRQRRGALRGSVDRASGTAGSIRRVPGAAVVR